MNESMARASVLGVRKIEKNRKNRKNRYIFFSSKMIGDHCRTKFQSFFPLTGDDRCDDRCQKIEKMSKIILLLKMMGDHCGTKLQ